MPTYNFPTRSNGQIIDASHINAVADAVEELGPLVDAAGGGGSGNATSIDGIPVDLSGITSGRVLKYNGTAIVDDTDLTSGGATGSVTVSATAPSSPVNNQLWLDTDDGQMYRYDSSSGQWEMFSFGAINVKHFGALANNSHDDTAAIQAALDFAHASAYAPVIVFPPGNYRVTNTLTFYNGTKVWGWGSGNTHSGNPKFLWDGPDNLDFWSQQELANSNSTNSHDTWFRNIGASKSVTFTGSNGSAITGGNTTFRHGIVWNNRGDRGSIVENCGFQYGYGWGVYFTKGGINTEVRGGRADGMRQGYVCFKTGGVPTPNDSIKIAGPWTTDNRIFNENPTGGGSIEIDVSTLGGICYFSIDNGKLECNSPMVSNVGQITLRVSPTEGTYPQLMGSFDTVWVAHDDDTASEESLLVTPATDLVDLTMINCQLRNVVGIPMYSSTRALVGIGGRVPMARLGSRGPHVDQATVVTETRTNNFFTPLNMHAPPYMNGKQATIVTKVNPTTGLISGTTVYDGDLFMTRSGNTVTEHLCTSTGTVGTLSGVTASGAGGQGFITVNTTTGLALDQRITISGTNYTIIKNYGTSLQLRGNLTSTISGAAVSYKAPSFITRSSTWS